MSKPFFHDVELRPSRALCLRREAPIRLYISPELLRLYVRMKVVSRGEARHRRAQLEGRWKAGKNA